MRRVTLLSLGLALVGCDRETPAGPFARARVIGGLDEVIGGEKAIAREGDLLLENEHFRAAIVGGRNSRGPGLYGGSLVDADLRWDDAAVDGGEGRDQWNEMFPTVNMNVPLSVEPEDVTVLKDGADGEAVVRVVGKGEPFLTMLWALWRPVAMPEMWLVHDYIARAGEPWMTQRTVVTFEEPDDELTPEPVEYPVGGLDVIGDGVENGIIMGDFFLGGGSVDVFAPGIGFDEDGAVFRATEEGRNIFADPFEFPFVAGVSDGVSYGIVPKEGSAYIPLFTASQTAIVSGRKGGTGLPGRFPSTSAFEFERYFLIGHGDVASIVDQYLAIRDLPRGKVRGVVLEQGTGLPMSDVDVFVYEPGAEFPWSQFRTDVRPDDSTPDGSFEGSLPAGDWELLVHRQGRPDGARARFRVNEGEEVSILLQAERPGVVSFTIRDETGSNIPAKVSIFKDDPNGRPQNRQPALGDPFIAGDPEWVVFAERGEAEVILPPGGYYAVASRGIEYEIDVSEPFRVDQLRSSHLDLQVFRSIDTAGWVSADLHVHSAPSHDSGVTLEDRVRTMVCEGVEFFTSNDHDVITDFAPVIEAMGLQDYVQSAVGVETTTIEQGHFLAFPLKKDFLGDVGGAFDWQGLPPADIISGLLKQGGDAGYDPLIFVAHPRDGILGYFDQYGFDPFAGEPGDPSFSTTTFYSLAGTAVDTVNEGSMATLDFDALELFTSKRIDNVRKPTVPEQEAFAAAVAAGDPDETAAVSGWLNRTMEEQAALESDVYRLSADLEGNIDDWFTLLNLGYRHTAIGNSDTHGLTSTEAGCPRNFVMAPTDDPGFLDDQEMADAIKAHRVVASYGPFVRLWVDGAEIGSDVTADGPVEIQIEVQAPSWIAVDRVELYENGTLIQEWAVEDGPSNLRFFETLTREPAQDAWYVAIAIGDRGLEPVFTAVEIPYIPLDEAVTGALGRLTLFQSPLFAALLSPVYFPKKYPVLPYALTNPIWVDADGDGWTPPGRPGWLRAP